MDPLDGELEKVASTVRDLSDLELATLICLIAQQHCLVETEQDLVEDVSQELALIVTDVFHLSYAVLSPKDYLSHDAFVNAILGRRNGPLDEDDQSVRQSSIAKPSFSKAHDETSSFSRLACAPGRENLDSRRLVNVIIAKDFNLAPEDIQIQALELIRLKRIFSHTAIHSASEQFLFLPVCSNISKGVRLNKHLIDRLFISHYHGVEDGFPNLEEIDTYAQSDGSSSPSSIAKRESPSSLLSTERKVKRGISRDEIGRLREFSATTTISAEVRRYLQNIVVFLRLERGVAGGVSPNGTVQFENLTKLLAPLHGIHYATPSLVALAARKVYAHRLVLCAAGEERSLQYGSDIEAVQDVLDGLTAETVIEAVLNSVACPL